MLWHYLSFPCLVWDLPLWLWSRGVAMPPFWTSLYLPQLANLRVWLPRMVWAQCRLQVLFPLMGTFMGFPATPQPLDLSRCRSFPGALHGPSASAHSVSYCFKSPPAPSSTHRDHLGSWEAAPVLAQVSL